MKVIITMVAEIKVILGEVGLRKTLFLVSSGVTGTGNQRPGRR